MRGETSGDTAHGVTAATWSRQRHRPRGRTGYRYRSAPGRYLQRRTTHRRGQRRRPCASPSPANPLSAPRLGALGPPVADRPWRTVGVNYTYRSTGEPSRLFWGKVLAEGPNLPPFSSFSTDLDHFILKLMNFDIYLLFCYFLKFI